MDNSGKESLRRILMTLKDFSQTALKSFIQTDENIFLSFELSLTSHMDLKGEEKGLMPFYKLTSLFLLYVF